MKNKQVFDLSSLIRDLKKHKIQKIIVTGNACSGKTTLTKHLSKQLNIPVTHLDTIVWKENFIPRQTEDSRKIINKIIEGPSWIIDGVSSITCEKAECIIFLDTPLHKILCRAILRCLKSVISPRPELPNNCYDWKIPHLLIKIIWNFKNLAKPKIHEIMMKNEDSKVVVNIRKIPALRKSNLYIKG